MLRVGARGDRRAAGREASLRTPAARPASAATAPCPSASRRCAAPPRPGRRSRASASSLGRMSGSFDRRPLVSGARPSNMRPARSTWGRSSSSSSAPSAEPVQPRDIVERRRIGRAAGASARPRPSARDARWCAAAGRRRRAPSASGCVEPPGRGQRLERVERRRRAHRRIAAAVDHLLDLDEELDLANAAAAALEVVARADLRALREMVADPRRNLPDLVDHAEIERAAPHERLDRCRGSAGRARCRRRRRGRG